MTTLDPGGTDARLAEIRARYEKKKAAHDMLADPSPARHTGRPGEGSLQLLQIYAVEAAMSADDVPWLLAQVERLRSDYEARGSVIESLKREVTQVSLAAEKKRTAAAIARNARLWARLEAEEAENRRLRPVVEAVRSLRDDLQSASWRGYSFEPIIAAVDALGTDAADGAGTGEPTYLTPVLDSLTKQLPGCDPRLIRYYALLAFVEGVNVTREHVHDAWSLWQAETEPDHRSLVPFAELTPEVQELDAPYAAAIRVAALEVASPAGSSTADEGVAR